jgi:hypothetical protein
VKVKNKVYSLQEKKKATSMHLQLMIALRKIKMLSIWMIIFSGEKKIWTKLSKTIRLKKHSSI